MGTIIVAAILAVLVTLVIISMVKRRRSGKSSCSCGCEGCPSSANCSIKKVENQPNMR